MTNMEDTECETGHQQLAKEEVTTEEVLSHLEFGLWTAVVLIPMLYWVNGPSVSGDQFVIRSILAIVAYVGAPVVSLATRKST